MNFDFKIGVPSWSEASKWGDYHFARALSRVLEARGHRCRIQILPEWDGPMDRASDVTIHLWGLSAYRPKPGPLNVVWIISHPERFPLASLSSYDLVLAASTEFAGYLSAKTEVPVFPLLQFADTQLMYPDPCPDLASEVLFVGNSRKVFRPIIRDILPTDRDLHIWGTMWEDYVPARYLRGQYFPYEQVRRLYSSCAILLNDHWEDMARWGFVNNRIFDALACGAFVISDSVAGLDALFPGAVLTYAGRGDLAEKVRFSMESPEAREEMAALGRGQVLARHGVEARVSNLLAVLEKGVRKRRRPGPWWRRWGTNLLTRMRA